MKSLKHLVASAVLTLSCYAGLPTTSHVYYAQLSKIDEAGHVRIVVLDGIEHEETITTTLWQNYWKNAKNNLLKNGLKTKVERIVYGGEQNYDCLLRVPYEYGSAIDVYRGAYADMRAIAKSLVKNGYTLDQEIDMWQEIAMDGMYDLQQKLRAMNNKIKSTLDRATTFTVISEPQQQSKSRL